jgi:hypothetical protein
MDIELLYSKLCPTGAALKPRNCQIDASIDGGEDNCE